MKKGLKSNKIMIKHELNLSINEPLWQKALPDLDVLSGEVFSQVLDYVSTHEEIDFLTLNKPINVNLCLSNDAEVHALNKEFRGKDKPTNVLSFANIDDDSFDELCQSEQEIELGNIIIALETMEREAKEQEISLHDHYCHLLAHGFLHLLGYDHIEEDEARHMESFEIAILQRLNINNPYEE